MNCARCGQVPANTSDVYDYCADCSASELGSESGVLSGEEQRGGDDSPLGRSGRSPAAAILPSSGHVSMARSDGERCAVLASLIKHGITEIERDFLRRNFAPSPAITLLIGNLMRNVREIERERRRENAAYRAKMSMALSGEVAS